MMNIISNKERDIHHAHAFKHRLIVMAALIKLIIIAYYYLISSLGIEIKNVM